MIKPQTLKGFRDFLPQEAQKREWLRQKLIKIFNLWGYDPLETPTLEPLELFAGQIGEEEKLFFKFKDQGGRDVAMRFDQTVPVCRVVAQYGNDLPMPFRRYQIQPAFRAEKPQKGRYREFTQCDADIFGVKSPLADAEVIALSLDIYRRLGFKQAKVLINDRTLLKDLPYPAVTAIDKLKKIGPDGVISEMVKKGIAADRAKTYLNQVKNLKPNHAIKVILDYLKLQNFDSGWYEFDPTIARSFSYSSGPIWEVVIPGFSGGSVLGGERFDQLVKKISGIDIPGTGFGLGFDRTLEAADEQDLIPKMKTVSRVLVAVFNPDFLEAAGKTAAAIRDKNLNVELFPDPEVKLDKQLKYANKKGIPFVLLIGPDEAAKNMVTLKDMKSGEQKTLTLDQAIDVLAR
ncbi:histidine--tRNA ligase [Candidatus Beckwithbacteria bacterium RIFCSPLOWO2_02_FULL_47_23]|uniref:Histidine--tRNA ligase n=2 Tax=Candidatus Beckwithiibacteriota TaxID=1752726 RepID=A0A1F5DYH3_9BACT|nr:MAG: histidine--tRNA ligase [Candidatus Beckwithbacteria bacterium RIFCSPHIGHO2_12_FULL_47_17]OGD60198.1 MAG: histidine--tRNA ligase [Candidatus Beckwithbacteria bacterium RIFCSPLOWO2_02_FULL_47_23]